MALPSWLQREGRLLLDLLLPETCPLCREQSPAWSGGWCRNCRRGLDSIPPSHCPCCALPYPTRDGPAHHCGDCLKEPPGFSQVAALGLYQGRLRDAILQLKSTRQPTIDKALGQLLLRRLRRCRFLPDQALLVPVPLHPSRLRQRSFNQSLLIARQLATGTAYSLQSDLLQRQYPTPHQQGLSAIERRRNLNGAFSVSRQLQGETVVLVDDVLTTGATARECATALLSAGAGEIRVAVLARATRQMMGKSLASPAIIC